MEILTDIFGYAAAICMVFGYLPQAIHTIRTRHTDSIALPTFMLMGFGGAFFIVQGILTYNIPLVITNVLTTVCCIIITSIKLHNDHAKKSGRKPENSKS